ncbi:MAG TPA: SDR family NAD(P)-dependent oxidoreductase [Mycobacteriales bacterium]|nr:SDR family NAD(P)-dependent oxidoreductase [Mycobacteriales bacterium]
MQLSGAVVIVTGAASGIGRATAVALAARGSLVVAVDRDGESLADLSAQVDVLALEVDVRDPSHADHVVQSALSAHRQIDAIVANVGIGYVGDFATMPVEAISVLLEVNLRAPMLLARAALPQLLDQGTPGALVFTTSIAGTVPVPTEAVYSLSKTALESFADSLREELRDSSIVVSTVRPGVVRTAFHERRNTPYERRFPRPIAPAQIARAILDVLDSGAERRTVPRWLDLAARARRWLPWLYRPLARRLG